jgi:transposase
MSAISDTGLMRYMTYISSMNAKVFIKFLKNLVASANGTMVYLIVDNLKVHHCKEVMKWVEEHSDKIQIFYLPAYSPDLNPLECLNNIMKERFQKQSQPRTKDELSGMMSRILKTLQKSPALIKNIFKKEEFKFIVD